MKRTLNLRVSVALLLAAAPLASVATTFFSDNFSNASTLTNANPALPTANSTSYQLLSGKAWATNTSLAAGHLQFGIAPSSGGNIEVQALFATQAVALVAAGNYIQLSVTFTNTIGLLDQRTYLSFGLYNASGVGPVPGGLNATMRSDNYTAPFGYAQDWEGYVAIIAETNYNSGFYIRTNQSGTGNNNQDAVTTQSQTYSYYNPRGAPVIETTDASVTLATNAQYTEIFTCTLTTTNTLQLESKLYTGPDNTGTLLSTMSTNTGAPPLADIFDSLAIGWYTKESTYPTFIDINSITVAGQVTVITGPPLITSQPVSVVVPSGGTCPFSVSATGVGVTYQWKRHGTNLFDDGNISGATSDTLIISPAGPADALSGANGYFVTVTGAGNYSTNSTTNSLTLGTAHSLVWSGSGTVWDLGVSASWVGGATFNYGDSVTFDDTGAGNLAVTLTGSFLSAASVTVNSQYDYVFQGTGNFAGPGYLLYKGAGHLRLNNVNSYSGGTIISNASAYLVLGTYNALGTGPVTLAKAGGQMEIVPAGGASVGINGDVIVADDFTIQFDDIGSYAGVFLGDLSGTAGKTLTLTPKDTSTTNRFRAYGANTVYNANLVIVSSGDSQANYYGTTLAPYNAIGSQTYNGIISGSGGLIQRGDGTTILNGTNTYSGGTTPSTGVIAFGTNTAGNPVTSGPIGTGPLFVAPESPSTTGRGTVMAWQGARTIANPIQYPSATNNQTLRIGGTNALTFTGLITLNGNDGLGSPTNRIFEATNTALTTFSGVISDGGLGFGLIKTGDGILALNNTETYTGPTVVSNGTLRVGGQLAAGSAVTVATNGILGGTGTVNGSVTVNQGGALAPGASIGTLNIGGNLTIVGNLNIEVNRSATPSSDRTVVTGTLSNTGTGTVTVVNLGAALQVGDTFTLFNKAVTGGNTMTVTDASYATWTNKLAIDGTIAVVAFPIITNTPVSGNTVTLSWPASYLGWSLQSNSVSVVSSTNWFTVPNSSNATQFVITVDPAKTNVFYRLFHPR